MRHKARRIVLVMLCTLVVGGAIYISLAVVWGRDLQQAQSRWRADGLPTALAQVIPSCQVDQNAAPLYTQAFVMLTQESGKTFSSVSPGSLGPDYRRIQDLYTRPDQTDPATWTQRERDDALSVLESPTFMTIYSVVKNAAQRSHCCFDLAYEQGPSVPLPQIISWRELARMLASRCRLLALDGRIQEASEGLLTMLAFGRQVRETPFQICQVVSVSMDSIAIDALHRNLVAGAIPTEYWIPLATALDQMDAKPAYLQAVGAERWLIGEWVFDAFGTANVTRTAKLLPDTDTPILGIFGGKLYGSFLGAPLLAKDHAIYVERMLELHHAIEDPSRKPPEPNIPWYALCTGLLQPSENATVAAISLLNRHRVNVDLARMSVALEREYVRVGAYPETLSGLIPDFLSVLPQPPSPTSPWNYRRGTGEFVLSAQPMPSSTEKLRKKWLHDWTWGRVHSDAAPSSP